MSYGQGSKGGVVVGGGGRGVFGALKCLSWSPEPKASLDLESEQKCCFWLNGALE